jgi:hypothetical protein
VTVFGHVVREGKAKTEVKEESNSSSSTASQATAATSSSNQSPVPSTPATPVIPPVAPVQSPTPSQLAKPVTNATEPTRTAIRQVKMVTLSLAPDMMNKTSADSRFNDKALLEVVKTELQSRKLLDTSDTQTGATLSIYIDNYDLHATTNFSIFGAKPHTGTLAGNLMLSDEQGESTPISHIEAYSRISVPENGGDKNLLQPLYRDFAVTVANSLAGTHVATSAEREQPPR